MTKRVLSLLLALVMALSLCVPAFAAEAPVDEAEEVGAEVVDAPAEVAVDEPEVIVYADEGVLQALVNQANGIKAGVANGEYQDAAIQWPTDMNASKGETMDIPGASKYFLNRLEDAEDILAEIADAEGGFHVWYKDEKAYKYDKAVDSLKLALNLVTPYIRKDRNQINEMNYWIKWYNDIIDANDADSYGIQEDYQPDFVEKVEAALADLLALQGYDAKNKTFTEEALYKDYLAANKTISKLYVEEAAAGGPKYPDYDDYIELRDAIRDARAQLASDAYFDRHLYWVGMEGELTHHKPDSSAPDGLEEMFQKIEKDFYLSTSATGFKPSTKLYQVHKWLNEINTYVVENEHTLTIDQLYTGTDYKYFNIAVTVDGDWTNDCRSYHLEVSGTKTVKSTSFTAQDIANGIETDYYIQNMGNNGQFDMCVTPDQLGLATEKKFTDGATITVKLVCDRGGEAFETKPYTVDQSYNGPMITSATYTAANDTVTVKLDKSLGHANGVTPNKDEFDNNQYDSATLTLSYNGEVVDKITIDNTTDKIYANTFTFKLKPVELGDYTVELSVKGGQQSGGNSSSMTRDSKKVTVPDITAYVGKASTDKPWGLASATGYNNLEVAIGHADNVNGLIAKNGHTERLYEQLAARVKTAKDFTAKAASTPDSQANETKVDELIASIYEILKNFEKAADPTALEDALDAAAALVETDYNSPTKWADLEKAVEAGEELAAKLPLADTEANQKKIADAAAAITKIIDDLNAHHIIQPVNDLATLKSLIYSVPGRLAADDYSAESKAAVNAAVAAAQPLLTKKGVLKSEVNAAIDALQTALNNLTTVKSDAIPACPVGNGWAQAENGDYYYYDKNGKLVVNDWVPSKGLWYHMGATGKMDTGFLFIEDKWGGGYYYLNPSNTKGTMGRMFTGWKLIDGHWAWFETRSNGHQGQCTYTDYWGDFVNYRPVQK